MSLQTTPQSDTIPPRSFRFVIYALTIAMCVICYGDRAALSVGMPRIAQEFALTPAETGWVLSSFLWSYFVLNLPSAIVLDRVGVRIVGAAAVALWSLAMILGSLAATVPAFIATRVLLGIGEAPTFSLGNKVVRAWAPVHERGVMMTAFICGIPVGLAGGAAAGAWLVAHFGWRTAFSGLGALGLVWSVVWLLTHPEQKTVREQTHFTMLSVPTLFRSSAFWGVVIPQCCANYANFLLMSWLPVIMRQTLHLDLMQSGAYTAYAYLGAAAISVMAGKAGETLVRGHPLHRGARRNVVCLYLVLASLMGLLPLVHSASILIPLLAVSMAFMAGGTGANMALLADLLVEHELLGSVTGLTLTFSNGLGIIAPVMTGYLVQATGNFRDVFYITAAIILCGAVAARFVPRRPIHALPARDDIA
ncbi:MFS transporter [Gluconacetobacter azotocaptans]|uniref:MFS transporter n=2 Tax=Gluconacetobacter azotocaptans TaxID=142834 RepID=A0A7W4JT35_9PROT|nr:MFS transporter [Gluconacetobacter azotocaptans]GBQ27371.1 glucarate/galactarate transporter [Gluconacetobacter azotocaptans DSM 13594]